MIFAKAVLPSKTFIVSCLFLEIDMYMFVPKQYLEITIDRKIGSREVEDYK